MRRVFSFWILSWIETLASKCLKLIRVKRSEIRFVLIDMFIVISIILAQKVVPSHDRLTSDQLMIVLTVAQFFYTVINE